MIIMTKPKRTAPMINALLTKPSVEKETFIKMVDITKPEFLIIWWNLSE